jgi:hypothetical protein
MDATNNIAKDLFYKIRSRFTGLKLGNNAGVITIMPEDARFFDFDYMEREQAIGHVSISLAEPNSMKVYFSTGITENMDADQKQGWYTFLRELRQFAKRRLMAFDTRDIAKDNLDQRDFAFLSQNAKPKTDPKVEKTPVGESIMSESQLYGTKTVSYQKLMDTRLVIKHSQTLNDDMAPGARSRNISALFVENQDGERFKYPFIHLAGARAMQRHVANSGRPYDDLGKSIIGMSEQIAQLKSFSNYVVRNDLMNHDNNEIIEQSQAALNGLRERIAKLGKQSHYEAYKESFQAQEPLEVPQDVVEDFTERFTVRNFKEEIKSVFPVLYRIMKENNKVDYEDIVSMTAEESGNDEAVIEGNDFDEFDQFENWVMGLGEASSITSDDQDEKAEAMTELQELVGQHFSAGVDGTNAIESLKGIIDDPKLFNEIKQAAKEDSEVCVRPMVKAWLEQNAPEAVEELDFGDMEEVSQEEPADGQEQPEAGADAEQGQEEPQMAGMDQQQSKKTSVKELAEFIQSFYDRESGTFPKGPEGVCTMVGKKFGEQAEKAARKFIERMAPQQTTENNPELQELARIRELSGLQSNEAVTQEAAGSYIWDETGDDQDKAQLRSMAQRVVKMYQHAGEVEASEDEIMATLDEIVRKYMPEVGKITNVAPVSQEFFDKFPLKRSEPEFDDNDEEIEDEEYESTKDNLHSSIWGMVKIAHDAGKGDTSMYGYKVHSKKEDTTPELEDIRRLSGIGQGIGF